MRWFAVYCKPQQEGLADRVLRQKGYKTFFPHQIKWVGRGNQHSRLIKQPYMTRYLFVEFSSEGSHQSFYEVNEQPGVASVVCAGVNQWGERVPFPIPDDVMHKLLRLGDTTGLMHEQRLRKNQLLINGEVASRGDKVGFAEDSPFWGLVAIIEEVLDDGEQIRLRLQQMFGAERTIKVHQRQVRELVR